MEILTKKKKREFYKALIEKNQDYKYAFYVGSKTTGVFCRPTCPTNNPKFENCEFYLTAKKALQHSFKPCLRCKPLSCPDHISDLVRTLITAIEAEPSKRWKASDLKKLSINDSTARRHFKKRFAMTFIQYSRARRIELARKQIQSGERVLEAQLNVGYESSSGFKDAFSKIMGAAPTSFSKQHNILKESWLDTPLGTMLAVADKKALYLLEFIEKGDLEPKLERLRLKTKSVIIPGTTSAIIDVEKELKSYFEGNLKEFKTPLHILGTPSQKRVWKAVMKIPYGKISSYAYLANAMGKPLSYKSIANAIRANQIAILIPCHRIINSSEAAGNECLVRKKWLIAHEVQNK